MSCGKEVGRASLSADMKGILRQEMLLDRRLNIISDSTIAKGSCRKNFNDFFFDVAQSATADRRPQQRLNFKPLPQGHGSLRGRTVVGKDPCAG